MPRKTWDTKADFDGAYDIGLEPEGRNNTLGIERRGNYVREALFNTAVPSLDIFTREWSKLIAHFAWPTRTSICILGTGFGWSIEYLNSQGFDDVWGIDNSAYIQGAKDEIDPGDGIARSLVSSWIHDADFSQDSEMTRFLRDSGHDVTAFDVCVTERVLSSLEDAEVVNLSSRLRALNVITPSGDIIHLESSPDPHGRDDPLMNFKTADNWKTLLPDDSVTSGQGSREILSVSAIRRVVR